MVTASWVRVQRQVRETSGISQFQESGHPAYVYISVCVCWCPLVCCCPMSNSLVFVVSQVVQWICVHSLRTLLYFSLCRPLFCRIGLNTSVIITVVVRCFKPSTQSVTECKLVYCSGKTFWHQQQSRPVFMWRKNLWETGALYGYRISRGEFSCQV